MIDYIVKAWHGEYSIANFYTPTTYNNPEFLDEIMPMVEERACWEREY